MTCSAIIASLGYECRELADNTLEVDTAFSFADGEAMTFYVRSSGSGFVLSDNADALAHLLSVGLPLRTSRSMSPIAKLVGSHGVTLTPRGEVRIECPAPELGSGIARFLSALIEISRFERDRLGLSEAVVAFSDEVELYLRSWKPNAEIVKAPTILGATGGAYEFDFQMNGTVIDCIAAKGRSTGALLRKASDVRARERAPDILAVIDDRIDPIHAAHESNILAGSGLVSTLLMTRLMQNARANSEAH